MLYFHDARLVVFATPKTGSTALQAALQPHADIVLQGHPAIKHCTFHRYKWRFEKFIAIFADEPPETCALIRDPEDWLASWYRFRQGSWLQNTPRSTRGLSFADFVDAYLRDRPPPFAAVGAQARFLSHPKRDERVARLFRYDAFDAFTAWLQDRLGTAVAPGRHNASAPAPVALPAALRARLQDRCAADYELYHAADGGTA